MTFLKSKRNYLAAFCTMFAIVAMMLVGCQKDVATIDNVDIAQKSDVKVEHIDEVDLYGRMSCSSSVCPVTEYVSGNVPVCCGGALLVCDKWRSENDNCVVYCNCINVNSSCRTSTIDSDDLKELSHFMATEMGDYGKHIVALVVAYQSELINLLDEESNLESPVNIAANILIDRVASIEYGLFSEHTNYQFTQEDVELINNFLAELSSASVSKELKVELNNLIQKTPVIAGKSVRTALKDLSASTN